MTGFGKAETTVEGRKYVVEIRSLNGKNADISLKNNILPKERELPLRQYLSKELVRGNIDVFISEEKQDTGGARKIDSQIFSEYFDMISELASAKGIVPGEYIISAVLRLPDVISSDSREEISDEASDAIAAAVEAAAADLRSFRIREGEVLRADLLKRVDNILHFLEEAETYEQERIVSVKERIVSRLEEIKAAPDHDRLEQEMIFYIEKLDINEEKVRLRQHCRYFSDTMDSEECPGRKLGFIAQEMGREINTLGSKSNHAQMQKCVVMMKDELEKIKEQVLNVL